VLVDGNGNIVAGAGGNIDKKLNRIKET